MPNQGRMTEVEFFKHCENDVVNGYTLKPGQRHPENYEQLVEFIATKINVESLTIGALSGWLMDNRTIPGSCSPEIDTEHVTTVILIGELDDRDEYVASFPAPDEALLLPPPNIVRRIIDKQRNP